tara:strand:- start:608 stop:757 length:150 start_codon:yes stop_codon:yes gene_type:complete
MLEPKLIKAIIININEYVIIANPKILVISLIFVFKNIYPGRKCKIINII